MARPASGTTARRRRRSLDAVHPYHHHLRRLTPCRRRRSPATGSAATAPLPCRHRRPSVACRRQPSASGPVTRSWCPAAARASGTALTCLRHRRRYTAASTAFPRPLASRPSCRRGHWRTRACRPCRWQRRCWRRVGQRRASCPRHRSRRRYRLALPQWATAVAATATSARPLRRRRHTVLALALVLALLLPLGQ